MVNAMIETKTIILSVCAFMLVAVSPALAGLSVAGSICDAEVTPGQHFEHDMIVSTDPEDRQVELQVDVMGFGRNLQGMNFEVDPDDDTSPYSARPFLQVSPRNFTLSPGSSQNVLLEGDIPADIGEGGRYALVLIHSNVSGSGNVGVAVAIEVPVRLTIAETKLIKTGEIADLRLDRPVSPEMQNISLIFNNTGNYNYYAFAEAVLKDKDGRILSNTTTPVTFNSILPATSMQFDMSIKPSTKLPAGSYSITSTIRMDDGTALASDEIEFEI